MSEGSGMERNRNCSYCKRTKNWILVEYPDLTGFKPEIKCRILDVDERVLCQGNNR